VISRIWPPENSVQPATLAQWRRWLARNHARAEGVWLVAPKNSSGKSSLDYDQAVEEALCFGWIDSRTRALDAERRMWWMSPRKARSGWSKLNKERVARLAASERLAPPGLAKIAAAKKDGSWTLLDDVEALVIPPDLAKKPETRAKRIAETAKLAKIDVRVNMWPGAGKR
jgi:uncharacterized protein YdeI (YjbR/CyaY-like superfamily)